jgi:nitrogenase molybdenum-iron protein alpha/beta subunit
MAIAILAKITGDASYKEICYAHRARLNVVISAKPLVKMAKKMEERFSIPYIEESFSGMEDISRCLRNIATKLGDSDLQEHTENLIAEETAALDQQLAPYINRLQGKRIVILSESLKSWAIISAAKNLKMEAIIISAKKMRKEDRTRIKDLLGEDTIILEHQAPTDILQLINEHQVDILIASDRYQSTTLKAQIPLLDINDGFAAAVESILKEISLKSESLACDPKQITILAGSAFTSGDVQEIKDIVSSFGLQAIIVPDLSRLLEGNFHDSNSTITTNGTTVAQLHSIDSSVFTLALGESMRSAAQILEQSFSTPYEVFGKLTGLEATDKFLQALADISGINVPEKYRRQRRQLQNLMLETHSFFGCKRVSLALEPDLLWSTIYFLQSMGVQIHAAVTTTRSPVLEKLPIPSVTIGDFEDFEQLAVGSDLLIANSHATAVAQRLKIPLYREGIPIFDRLGNSQLTKISYQGTMQLLFDIGNLFLEAEVKK